MSSASANPTNAPNGFFATGSAAVLALVLVMVGVVDRASRLG